MPLRASGHHSFGVTACATVTALTGLLVSLLPLQASEYPVVFKSATALRELGISVGFIWKATRPFQNKCYFYGEGSYLISISDEFLARFQARGFTVQSACLGLVSETRYDPETGRRLPTYVIADQANIARDLRERGMVDSLDAVSEELPLDLPDCFKNGNPYTDCTFRFGRKTGKRLSTAETEIYRQLGATLDKGARALMMTGKGNRAEFVDRQYGVEVQGFRETAAGSHLMIEFPAGTVDEKLQRYSSASFWVRSSRFPRGYGYALDASGEASPSVSADTVKAAIDGSSKSQINVEELRRLLNSRR